jgi:hypothetical protein
VHFSSANVRAASLLFPLHDPPSCMIRPLFCVLRRVSCVLSLANHFERFARFDMDSTIRSRPARLFARIFFHKPLGMLEASSRGSCYLHAPAVRPLFFALDRKQDMSKIHISRAFSSRARNSIDRVLQCAASRSRALAGRGRARNIWCRCTCGHARSSENAGFFIAL